MAKNKNSGFKVLSLFSGGMGLDIGLHEVGEFELLACIEKDPACCETIEQNKQKISSSLRVYEGDISQFDPLEVMQDLKLETGELDLIVGGPPCQAFSTAGKRKSVEDPRGTLLWQFLKYVEVFQPKAFLMENVRGLLSAALKHRPISERPDKGGLALLPEEEQGSVVRMFSNDLRKLDGAKYHLDIFEVNSVNYGAPQIRERALFIGNRFGHQIDFPDPTHVNPLSLTNETKDMFAVKKAPWRTLRDAIGDMEEIDPEVMDFSPRKKSFLELVPEGGNWRSLPEEIQKESMGKAWFAKGGRSGWWRRLSWDHPSPTLVTMPNHASTALCHPVKTRALSISEYARIQEFPDDWQFSGKTSQKYSQVGNAVPVRLGRVAGEQIAKFLNRISCGEADVLNDEDIPYRVVYVQSHVRTRNWFKGGRAVSSKDAKSLAYAPSVTLRKTKAVS